MKPVKKNTKSKVPTKGLRLRWEPLSSVMPVKLTPNLTKGNVVFVKHTSDNQNFLLVP
jgi:hypothetical protein